MNPLRVVIDTNIWIRILLGGRQTLPVLSLWRQGQFQLVMSEALFDEFVEVSQRPRLAKRIKPDEAERLRGQMRHRAEWFTLSTIPPRCRDPKDHPVLSTAIDGKATAIVSGDDDLRADDELRAAMSEYGVELWGITSLYRAVED